MKDNLRYMLTKVCTTKISLEIYSECSKLEKFVSKGYLIPVIIKIWTKGLAI